MPVRTSMENATYQLRWAVNCSSWIPCKQEWLYAVACIQREEVERINRFVFRRDTKLALVGRLLIRAAITLCLGVENAMVQLGRTARGKPILEGDYRSEINFNISHQGKFAVLATEKSLPVGVDVMEFSRPRGQILSEFFHTMRRQFTAAEWERIKAPATQQQQLAMFYRFWCLKESFIKAEGSGLTYGLQRLEFAPQDGWPPELGGVCRGSQLLIDRSLACQWVFEESLVDNEHCVAVAVGQSSLGVPHQSPAPAFTELTVKDLLSRLSPLHREEDSCWESFKTKEESPG